MTMNLTSSINSNERQRLNVDAAIESINNSPVNESYLQQILQMEETKHLRKTEERKLEMELRDIERREERFRHEEDNRHRCEEERERREEDDSVVKRIEYVRENREKKIEFVV